MPGNWLWLVICGLNLAVALGRILFHRDQLGFINLIMAALILLLFYGQRTTSWEIDTDCLLQRGMWINTKVRWQDVTRVESMWSTYYDLKIEYRRHGFGPRIGRVLANPVDRDAFLASLHQFAPRAEFIDKSSTKILDI